MFKKRRSRDDSISRGEDPVRKSPGTFHVFVTPDGTATLDGERLRSNGNRAETAVLDELHRHAKNRDSSVEATVLDQRHGWLLRVRVTPDGASELAGEPRELQLVADDPGSLPIGSETTVFLRTPASEEPVTSAIPVQAPPRSGGFVGPLRTDDRSGSEETFTLVAYPVDDPDAPQAGYEEPPTVAFPSQPTSLRR